MRVGRNCVSSHTGEGASDARASAAGSGSKSLYARRGREGGAGPAAGSVVPVLGPRARRPSSSVVARAPVRSQAASGVPWRGAASTSGGALRKRGPLGRVVSALARLCAGWHAACLASAVPVVERAVSRDARTRRRHHSPARELCPTRNTAQRPTPPRISTRGTRTCNARTSRQPHSRRSSAAPR